MRQIRKCTWADACASLRQLLRCEADPAGLRRVNLILAVWQRTYPSSEGYVYIISDYLANFRKKI